MIEAIDKKIKNIKTDENDRLRQMVKDLLNKGKTQFDQQDFRRAIETFNKILEQVPDHPEAQNYLKAAREAILVKEESQLTPLHRHYGYYITFKNRGEKFFNQAEKLSQNGKNITPEAKSTYMKSLEQWRTILLWFPNNEEAHEYIRKIYRRIDPAAYTGFLIKYVELIRLYLRPPNPQLERAHHLLLMIQKEDRDFFNRNGLAALLEQAKPQRLQTNLNDAQKNQIRGIMQEANIAFASKNDNRTIALMRQAININPFSNDPLMNSVKLLLTQAINRKQFGASADNAAAGPPPQNFREATRFYYQAMAAYQAKNYARTIQLCKQALKILPNYTQAQQLLRIAEQRL
jgi:tetratricopeptide (TPR) repeat protein